MTHGRLLDFSRIKPRHDFYIKQLNTHVRIENVRNIENGGLPRDLIKRLSGIEKHQRPAIALLADFVPKEKCKRIFLAIINQDSLQPRARLILDNEFKVIAVHAH